MDLQNEDKQEMIFEKGLPVREKIIERIRELLETVSRSH
jgi:hypothetical protein